MMATHKLCLMCNAVEAEQVVWSQDCISQSVKDVGLAGGF